MTHPTAEAVVRDYWERMASNDFASLAAVLAPDFVLDWPQSGERIVGPERYIRMNAEYPTQGRWTFRLDQLVADGHQVVTRVHVSDGMLHDDALTFFTVEHGLVTRIVEYWPAPFPPAEARRHLVEPRPGA